MKYFISIVMMSFLSFVTFAEETNLETPLKLDEKKSREYWERDKRITEVTRNHQTVDQSIGSSLQALMAAHKQENELQVYQYIQNLVNMLPKAISYLDQLDHDLEENRLLAIDMLQSSERKNKLVSPKLTPEEQVDAANNYNKLDERSKQIYGADISNLEQARRTMESLRSVSQKYQRSIPSPLDTVSGLEVTVNKIMLRRNLVYVQKNMYTEIKNILKGIAEGYRRQQLIGDEAVLTSDETIDGFRSMLDSLNDDSSGFKGNPYE